MIGQREPSINTAPPPRATHQHPPAGKRRRVCAELARPHTPISTRRRNNDRTACGPACRRRVLGIWQRDASLPIQRCHAIDRAVDENRTDGWIKTGEQPLRFAKPVAEQQRYTVSRDILAPPGIDIVKYFARCGPAINGQTERALGDEGVTAHRLPRVTGRVGIGFVVTGRNPHFAAMLEPHLCRTENVAGGMQRHTHAVDQA